MKFTRSLPANDIARANVPMSTVKLKIFTLQQVENLHDGRQATKVTRSRKFVLLFM